jgi:predicted metal-dependent phosphoesterase TrpH
MRGEQMDNNTFVDLHIHSCFSDGTMTPEEIYCTARDSGVGIIAVADHDIIEGNAQVRALCSGGEMVCVSAAEIDALYEGSNFHILAYGFNMNDPDFISFLSHIRFMLDEMNVRLVEAMAPDYSDISLEDYFNFTHDTSLGGWKALSYLMAKGLSADLKDGNKYYPMYSMTHCAAGFPSIASIAIRVKRAGGRTVLAHPGTVIDTSDINAFKSELEKIVNLGIDGLECYYPTYSPEVTAACLDLCTRKDLIITAGSDCHGAFGGANIGEPFVQLNELSLKGLIY